MSKETVLIFDIGKTNKKILLFDLQLNLIHEEEQIFEETSDDDGFLGDDIEKIESWILEGCEKFLNDPDILVRGINFTTYGATLIYLDSDGNRLTPAYNYLKPMPEGLATSIYEQHGGIDEFSRNTASPALGMLNSGLQALWLQQTKPGIFEKTRTILHFPQYLYHILTGGITSEHTSIGCHTALWDFDNMQYHEWTYSLGNLFPPPITVERTSPSKKLSKEIPVGIGIHDSSASLVPYLMHSEEEFILVSTGTWCISMNPFNHSPLTPEQLQKDCLAYLSFQQKPVKSSRFFLGHIHDKNVKKIAKAFGLKKKAYKAVCPNDQILQPLFAREAGDRKFFKKGVPEKYIDNSVDLSGFENFDEAYHYLMADLVDLTAESINLILGENDKTRNLYISGGFSKNEIFLKGLANRFRDKEVFTSEIPNATSLGAALVLLKGIEPELHPEVDIGLNIIDEGFEKASTSMKSA